MARFQDLPREIIEKVLLLAIQGTRGTTFAIDVGQYYAAPTGFDVEKSIGMTNWWDPEEPGREPIHQQCMPFLSRRIRLATGRDGLASWTEQQRDESPEQCEENAYAIFQVFGNMGPTSFRWYKRRPEDEFTILREGSPRIGRRYFLGPLMRNKDLEAPVHALVHSNAAELAFALMRTSKTMCWAMVRILDLHGRQIRASAWNMYPPARSQFHMLRATCEGPAVKTLIYPGAPLVGPRLPDFDIYGCEVWEARMRYLEASDMDRLGRRLWKFPHMRESASQIPSQDDEESETEEQREVDSTSQDDEGGEGEEHRVVDATRICFYL